MPDQVGMPDQGEMPGLAEAGGNQEATATYADFESPFHVDARMAEEILPEYGVVVQVPEVLVEELAVVRGFLANQVVVQGVQVPATMAIQDHPLMALQEQVATGEVVGEVHMAQEVTALTHSREAVVAAALTAAEAAEAAEGASPAEAAEAAEAANQAVRGEEVIPALWQIRPL